MLEIVEKIKAEKCLDENEQLQMFDSSKRQELLRLYLQYGTLCPQAQIKMLRQFDKVELLKVYLCSGQELSAQAQFKLFDLPERAELARIYLRKREFSPTSELRRKLLELVEDEYLV